MAKTNPACQCPEKGNHFFLCLTQGLKFYFFLLSLGALMVFAWRIDILLLNPRRTPLDPARVQTVGEPPAQSVKGRLVAGVDLAKVAHSTPDLIKQGETSFAQKCAACHGQTGAGDGVPMSPPPRNFKSQSNWKISPTVGGIFTAITQGLGAMPSFDTLPADERFALVHFIRSLAPDYPGENPEDIKKLDDLFHLSADRKEPNLAPITSILEKVSLEGEKSLKMGSDSLAKIVSTDALKGHGGAKIFSRFAINPALAIANVKNQPLVLEDLNRFIAVIGANAPANGFQSAILQITRENWAELHQFMRMLNAS